MALETGTVINDLVITNPGAGDQKSQGDDHLRLLKTTIKNSFPGFSGPVIAAGVSTGSTNAYVLSTPLISYSTNTVVIWSPSSSNNGNSTININGLGVANINRQDGSILQLGDLIAGQYVAMVYTGYDFRIIGVTKAYIDNVSFSSADAEAAIAAAAAAANSAFLADLSASSAAASAAIALSPTQSALSIYVDAFFPASKSVTLTSIYAPGTWNMGDITLSVFTNETPARCVNYSSDATASFNFGTVP